MAPLLIALSCLAAGPGQAATVLSDFETDADVQAWRNEGGGSNTRFPVTREERWATSGSFSLCFRSPKWQAGMSEWPACELEPAVTDWSGYDRLVLDITNPTAFEQKLMFFVTDSKVATRSSLLTRTALPRRSYTQVVVELADLAGKSVDLSDISHFHFFTERPAGDMELYVDRLCLLGPADGLPTPQPNFVKAMAAMQQEHIDALLQDRQEARDRVREMAGDSPDISAWAEALLAESDAQLAAFAEQVERGDPAVLEVAALVGKLDADTARLEELVALRTGFEEVREAVQTGDADRGDIIVGFATSMQKVLPRAGAPKLKTSRRASLALARNEKEALQVIVVPTESDARGVSVRVGDLSGPGGSTLPSRSIDAVPMGYVETKAVPPYGSSHVGWWPDPILDFMSEVDIAEGDAQSFWVRVRCPKGQAPGRYRGDLEVLLDGKPLYAFDMAVEVYPFTLPDRSPLNMAVTFRPMFYEPTEGGGWSGGVYRDDSWQKHKLEWGDFLADYYLTYDSLYTYPGWKPDFDVLTRLKRQGRLGTFNLGYYSVLPEEPEGREEWIADVRERIGKPYAEAKALGLLEHAYIYGCDEHPEDRFPGVERAAAFLKQEFPGTLILTTTYDHSFGTDSALKSMDGFCPLTPRYDRELADQVRAGGQEVWWYICCGPHHPHANMFIEYSAIEGRLLMGAQTAKYRPDGFLYYQISIWNSPPITTGPFTEWDPRSWTTYHGDGSWACLGPGGTPLATIRLENFRDGVEDYAYALLLEKAIAEVEAGGSLTDEQAAWVTQARSALEVPEGLSRSMTEYTDNPRDVYRWRGGMAEALNTLP